MDSGAVFGCAMMILHITTSGGIGGFGLGKDARLEVDALPRELRAETCEVMTPERLAPLAAAPADSGADRIGYAITLEDADGAQHRYEIGEAAMPPEMLDLIDALLAEAR